MPVKKLYRSFAGGEITPELHGRLDLTKFQTGVSECVNMVPLPHGPLVRRPATYFVAYSISDHPDNIFYSMDLEIGVEIVLELQAGTANACYYREGKLAETGGARYTFSAGVLGNGVERRNAARVKAPDELLVANELGVPKLITHDGSGNFNSTSIDTTAAPTAPAAGNITITVDHNYPSDQDRKEEVEDGESDQEYAVTYEYQAGESEATEKSAVTNNLTFQGASNKITISSFPAGVLGANVYKKQGGVYAYIGRIGANSSDKALIDDNIKGDNLKTPPEYSTNLGSRGGFYAQALGYFEQRLWWGGVLNQPQTLYASRTGQYYNMSRSRPTISSDSIEIRLDALNFGVIRHIIPLSDLVVLTDRGEWRIFATGSEGVTPTSITAKTQGYSGASRVNPVVTPSSILFAQEKSHRIRELTFSRDSDSFQSIDLTIMAPHLFVGRNVERLGLMKSPYQILWVLRSDGKMLSMTYQPDQDVFAWAQHDFGGFVGDFCIVKEGSEDILYLRVVRDFPGGPRSCIERMSSFNDDTGGYRPTPWHGGSYLDCGVTKSTASATVGGLDWLKGSEVGVLADGFDLGNFTVDGQGEIDLGAQYSEVSVGLRYESRMKTLPLAMETAEAAAQGAMKNITRAHLRVDKTWGARIGVSPEKFSDIPVRRARVDPTKPPEMYTGEVAVNVRPDWNADGQIIVASDATYPMTIVSMTLEVAPGA